MDDQPESSIRRFRRILAQVNLRLAWIDVWTSQSSLRWSENTRTKTNNPNRLMFYQNCFQFLATSVKNLILFDIGLQKAIPGIIIPALTGLRNDHNLNETLSLTSVQASWLGKKNHRWNRCRRTIFEYL